MQVWKFDMQLDWRAGGAARAAGATGRGSSYALPRAVYKYLCRIARAQQPVFGATAASTKEAGAEMASTEMAGTEGAPVAASSDDDGGGGDADPDGWRPRASTCLNFSLPAAPPSPAHPKPERLLRLPELKTRCGLSRSTIYQYIKDGKFPPPISIGARAVAWLESDIDRWIAEQVQSASASI